MGINKKLKKGFDINLAGKPSTNIVDLKAKLFAIKPAEFSGFTKPKVLVKEGDVVQAGDALYFDKDLPQVQFTASVSGKVTEVLRGEKRKLLEIRIEADDTIKYKDFGKNNISDILKLSREDVINKIAESGLWPSIIQRPFAVIAKPQDTPKAIFISGFESSPLAPDYSILLKGQEDNFTVGIELLKKLTPGKVNLSLHSEKEVDKAYKDAKGIEIHKFSGPHPVGNVGVQIHHIAPINKGDIVWTINPVAVAKIGKLFSEGIYDASKLIAVVGSEIKTPQYYKIFTGVNVASVLENNLKQNNVRVISGNVLTGTKIGETGYVGYYDNQVTVIPEGNDYIFFGSFIPSGDRLSFSRSLGLFSFLNKFINPKKEYVCDSNIQGEHRNFVVTGEFEKVVPMDIYPVYLLKAILAEDFDGMEELGIYEVAEEDFALCEFIDVSKNDIQKIVRQGIDLMLNN
jgi:Na+-transporting NADH:ubiquinone oxidoreductase subunit A